MKINKIIFIVLVFIICYSFSLTAGAVDFVEQVDYFEDENIQNYTFEELTQLIDYYTTIQDKAMELVKLAQELGWPETSEPIRAADIEYNNAQIAIDYYAIRYNELYVELEIAKWQRRQDEYPVATQVWVYMKNLGWNDYICAGIMGNLMAETGGQTLDLDPTAYSSNKNYYGICQWSKKYYSEVHKKDLEFQCNFLRDTITQEFNTFGCAYKKKFNFNSFLKLTNSKEAALAFAKCYERCGSNTYAQRKENAIVAYNYFVNN